MAKGNVIPFPQEQETLQIRYRQLQQAIQALDEKEPEDMDSEEYEAWAEEHEALEDDLDEILDRMEML